MSEGSAAQVIAREAAWCVLHGDSFFRLGELPPNSVDALLTDPPAGIAFMGRDWDKDKGGMREWIGWLACILERCMRAMKPGAHGLVWALPRTSHWTGMALEYAGFEIRGQIDHLFGSGFPKSLNVSAAIAAHAAEGGSRPEDIRRLVMGDGYEPSGRGRVNYDHGSGSAMNGAAAPPSGLGTAQKPAHEVWWLVRKPLERGLSVAENVLKWGTGALNIDACRVAHAGAADLAAHQAQVEAIKARGGSMANSWKNSSDLSGASDVNSAGRWPPDVVMTHSLECKRLGAVEIAANPTWDTPNRNTEPSAFTGSEVSRVRHANGRDGEASADKRYADQGSTSFAPLPGARRNDTETVEQWECVEGCPVRELAMQSGETKSGGRAGHVATNGFMQSGPAGFDANIAPSTGTSARYFPQFQHDPELDDITPFLYAAKPARSERDAGLEHFRTRSGAEATASEEGQARLDSPRTGAGRTGGVRNTHPTIKSQEQLRYFCRLITPPKGIVLTPFAGAGSEGAAVVAEGCRFIGIELLDTEEEPFVSYARARINYVEGRVFVPRESLRTADPPKQRSLFSFGESVPTTARTQGGGE